MYLTLGSKVQVIIDAVFDTDHNMSHYMCTLLCYLTLYLIFAGVHYKRKVHVVDLDIATDAFLVAALPDGRVVTMIKNNNTVVRLNEKGQIERDLYKGSTIRSLNVHGSDLFVGHRYDKIVQVHPQDGRILKVYRTGLDRMYNYASHQTEICKIPTNTLLLTTLGKYSRVFSYNISSQTVKNLVKHLEHPTSVSSGCVHGNVVYVVTNRKAHEINVYNANWSLVRSFGGRGSADGKLYYPTAAVMQDQGNIIVADANNYRVSVFTPDGQFVEHIIIYKDKERPFCLSVRGQYLWVTTYGGRLTRYIS